jgi:amidase
VTRPPSFIGKAATVAARLVVAALILLLPPKQVRGLQVMEATIESIHDRFEAGELTCTQLVRGYLDRIEAYDRRDPLPINAIQTVNPNAIVEAESLDAAFASSGLIGPLHCIPILVKDQFEVAGMPTTYGSALFKDFIPERDATIVSRLKKAGAIILAKTNMGAFGLHYTGSAYGVTRNPYALDRNPSGSSSGTGAGVAANFGTVGIGEDSGGSVRGPAARANAVGLRPTTPLISRFGMMPQRPSRDAVGPLARTVRDAAIVTDVIAGYDPNDILTAYSVDQKPETYTAYLDPNGLEGARIGVLRDLAGVPASEDYAKVKAVVDQAILDMALQGGTIIDPITIPARRPSSGSYWEEMAEAIDAYLEHLPNAPVSSFRDIASSPLLDPRHSEFLSWVQRAFTEGTKGNLEYLQMLRNSETQRQVVLKVMADNALDVLIYPTYSHQPGLIPDDVLEGGADPGFRAGSNRGLSSRHGFPALTVPAGFTTDDLPVGIEIMGRPFSEGVLFRIGYAYEQATLHRRPPPQMPELSGRHSEGSALASGHGTIGSDGRASTAVQAPALSHTGLSNGLRFCCAGLPVTRHKRYQTYRLGNPRQ